MNEAPKKIWIHDGFWLSGDSSYWSTDEKESEIDTQYIRADLVDGLVEALKHTAKLLEALGGTALMAEDALKALEETDEN